MNNSENIPSEDLILAKKLRNMNQESSGSVDINDPLLDDLFVFKKSILSASDKTELSERKRNSWNRIQNTISAERSQPAGHNSGFPYYIRYYWKAAAVIIFAVLLSVFYYQQTDTPLVEIASSSSTIETIILDNGSEVTLRPNSVFYSVAKTSKADTYRLEGEAYFSVTEDKKRTFNVETDNGVIQVLGTRFNVRTWQQETTVFLESGSLKLLSADLSNQIILEPEQFSVIRSDQTISEPEHSSREFHASWQEHEIIFNNRKAGSILDELEFHFSVQIEAGSEIRNTVLGGSISLENLDTSLQNLGSVLGGEFILIEDNKYQFAATE